MDSEDEEKEQFFRDNFELLQQLLTRSKVGDTTASKHCNFVGAGGRIGKYCIPDEDIPRLFTYIAALNPFEKFKLFLVELKTPLFNLFFDFDLDGNMDDENQKLTHVSSHFFCFFWLLFFVVVFFIKTQTFFFTNIL